MFIVNYSEFVGLLFHLTLTTLFMLFSTTLCLEEKNSNKHQTADRHNQQLADEPSRACGNLRVKYFPQKLEETKNGAQRE